MSKRADVYGRYSLGSGAILSDRDRIWSDLADERVLDEYVASMRRDLQKAGIAVASLRDWRIMDVGTGRQALAFLSLGAKAVDHFDISSENVDRMRCHIVKTGVADRLSTTCCDLIKHDLGRDRFEFVYLNGIVQHFSDVGLGLINCVRALRLGGLLWLYFYRSGTFDNFVLYMLRTLAFGGNIADDEQLVRDYYVAARLFFSRNSTDNYLTSIFMDGVCTRYARLYTPSTYLGFAAEAGLEVVSSSGLDPLGRDVDHQFARPATVITLRKVRVVEDNMLRAAANLLGPGKEIDQLDHHLYADDEILKSIDLYERVALSLEKCTVPAHVRKFLVLRLFAYLAERTRAADFNLVDRHLGLHELLDNIVLMLDENYVRAPGHPAETLDTLP